MVLSELKLDEAGVITGFRELKTDLDVSHHNFILRLMEMGLVVGAKVSVRHEAPFFGDPIAVDVEGNLIGLRRAEAEHIEVSRAEELNP